MAKYIWRIYGVDLYLHTKFNWNRRNFLWTYGRTYGSANGYLRPTLLGRLAGVDLTKEVTFYKNKLSTNTDRAKQCECRTDRWVWRPTRWCVSVDNTFWFDAFWLDGMLCDTLHNNQSSFTQYSCVGGPLISLASITVSRHVIIHAWFCPGNWFFIIKV